jgi:Fe2+ transport system protein B
MEQYKKQIEKEVKNFRTGVTKLQTSDNPIYNDPAVVEYETQKLKEALEKTVSELDAQFKQGIDARIEEQSKVAARSTFYVSPSDREFIASISDDLATKLTFAMNEADKLKALREYEEKLETFDSEAPFSEVIKQLADVSRKLGDDEFSKKKLRGLYNQLSAGLMTPEQEELQSLKDAKLHGVDHKYRTLKMTHPAFSEHQKARRM